MSVESIRIPDPNHIPGTRPGRWPNQAPQAQLATLLATSGAWMIDHGVYTPDGDGSSGDYAGLPILEHGDFFTAHIDGERLHRRLPRVGRFFRVGTGIDIDYSPPYAYPLGDREYILFGNAVRFDISQQGTRYHAAHLRVSHDIDLGGMYGTGRLLTPRQSPSRKSRHKVRILSESPDRLRDWRSFVGDEEVKWLQQMVRHLGDLAVDASR